MSHYKIELFDMTDKLPFSQGYALAAIRQRVGGRREAGGEARSNHGNGTILYARASYAAGDVRSTESLWLDDGYNIARCVRMRKDDGEWLSREGGDEWKPDPNTIVTIKE